MVDTPFPDTPFPDTPFPDTPFSDTPAPGRRISDPRTRDQHPVGGGLPRPDPALTGDHSCPECGGPLPPPSTWTSQVTSSLLARIAEQRCARCGWQHVWRHRPESGLVHDPRLTGWPG